jgi:hypothetical protein
MEKAMGGTVANAAKAAERFVHRNESAPAAPENAVSQAPSRSVVPGTSAAARLQGFLMEARDRSLQARPTPRVPAVVPEWAAVGVMLPVLAYLVAVRRRHKRSERL